MTIKMEKLLIFVIIAIAAANDMDPKCFVRPPYVNPRTCCLDPSIVKDDLHEKCMREVFRPRNPVPEIDSESDVTEANTIANDNNDESARLKRSIDDSSVHENQHHDLNDDDSSGEHSSDDLDSTSDDSVEVRRPHKHHRHHHHGNYPRYNYGKHHHGRRHHGKHHHGRHHHGKHHHGRHHHGRHHHGRHHDGGHHHFDYDTYAPVFHRDFAKWTNSVRFQKLSIYWSCVFNTTGIIDAEHNVIMPNVQSHLNAVLDIDNPFLPIMEEAFETCSIKRTEFLKSTIEAKEHYILDSTPLEREIFRKEHPKYNLNTNKFNQTNHAYFLIRCVKREAYKNCPDEKFRLDDKLCTKSRSYLKNCPYSARHFYQSN